MRVYNWIFMDIFQRVRTIGSITIPRSMFIFSIRKRKYTDTDKTVLLLVFFTLCLCNWNILWERKANLLSQNFTFTVMFSNALNQFLSNVSILYLLKTPENQMFSVVFRGYKMWILTREGLSRVDNTAQKVTFSKWISSPNPEFAADLVTFTEEILNEKLHCAVRALHD